MKVVAAIPGLKVPREDDPRKYITDDKAAAVEVEMTAYYIRRMADGELVEVADEQANPTDGDATAKAAKASK